MQTGVAAWLRTESAGFDSRCLLQAPELVSAERGKIEGMWQETKHGLYRQFNFENFKQAWAFMTKVAALAEEYQHHPRWENEWNVVQIWLMTHEAGSKITDKDRQLAEAIDAVVAAPLPPKN